MTRPHTKENSVTTSLAERLDSFPEGWRPKPGDKLIGLVTDVDSRESEYHDEQYPIVVVEAEEGSTQDGEMIPPGTELAWHAFHTMARREVGKQRPGIGDHIGIAYHGPAASAAAGMSPAERWRVVVDGRSTKHPPESTHDEQATSEAASEDAEPAKSEDDDIPF
jgi:hypothetical protein